MRATWNLKDDVNEPSSEWDYAEDPWVDLEPLILLELRKANLIAMHAYVATELAGMRGDGVTQGIVHDSLERIEDDWRTQMKALGRWDSRYEDET
jgi:hypothetical protein